MDGLADFRIRERVPQPARGKSANRLSRVVTYGQEPMRWAPKPSRHPWETLEIGQAYFAVGGRAASLLSLAHRWAARRGLKNRYASKAMVGGIEIRRVA